MRMQPDKAWASDANFTLRLTYGRVLPYDPADGIHYNYYTTLKGVMEKENPQNPTGVHRSRPPQELYAAKDFGRYANEGELPWPSWPTATLRAATPVPGAERQGR